MLEDHNHNNAKGQRKRRLEKEYSNRQPKNPSRQPSSNRKDQTYTKRHRRKVLQTSLENVSSNPLGDFHGPPESTLRRSRSLAISREDIFTKLEIPNRQRRRSQLIPRAKLIHSRGLQRGTSHESIYTSGSTISALKGLEYAVPQPQQRPGFKYREDINASHYLPTLRHSTSELDSLEHDYYTEGKLDAVGLSLPNYYPDSKCDTDFSFTDNTSLERESRLRQTGPESSSSNINISYDENIVLSKSTLYDKVEDHYTKSKPRTIRGNTPYHHHDSIENSKPRSLPNFGQGYESDSTLSDYDPKYYEPVEKASSDSNNEEVTRTVVDDKTLDECDESEFSNIEANPIYDEIPAVLEKELIKTSIQVPPEENEEFKTVVSVPETQKSDEEDPKEAAKKHSHNYLKEFLESQKGSKKPLQNFLSKRISRAFNSGDSPKSQKKGNLVENQYFSLPDITVSKNLQKCEKIDRKLRKCEKLHKSPSDASATNRFIVNIGNHFDVTASSSIPVDFELKISKIPRQASRKSSSASRSDKNFVEAVRNLNNTLKPQSQSCESLDKQEKKGKLIINGKEIKSLSNTSREFYQRDKEVEVLIEDNKMNETEKVTKEYQEKLNTMRSYWNNMYGNESQKEEEGKCKIISMQTKVEEAKKKFESDCQDSNGNGNGNCNKVKLTKQFFESNDQDPRHKHTKLGLLENPYFDNQFESLNANIVEIIEPCEESAKSRLVSDKSTPKKNAQDNCAFNKANTIDKQSITKCKSIEPEFDHVRYRVVKSDLFQKKIFAKCEKESQFDGLMQYLQDYSFQELLIDNNIVIIEPIRTNIQYISSHHDNNRPNKVTKFIRTAGKPPQNNEGSGLRKHFFYHPIRVNREVNDDELPNPDTVKQVRELFEGQRSQSNKNLESIKKQTVQYIRPAVDPDKDRCSASDSGNSNMSEEGDEDEYFEENDVCCEYVSEDILEKIRECGTSVTYYGGRILNKRKPTAMTNAIMQEIQSQKCSCKYKGDDKVPENNTYQGVKFKLLKSNSCSSRLELVGTKNLSEYRNRYLLKQKQLVDQSKAKQSENVAEINLKNKGMTNGKKHSKNVEKQDEKSEKSPPKIIAEEMKQPPQRKMVQWGEITNNNGTENKSNTAIIYHTLNNSAIKKEYQDYDKIHSKRTKEQEMDFEPYEVANGSG